MAGDKVMLCKYRRITERERSQ